MARVFTRAFSLRGGRRGGRGIAVSHLLATRKFARLRLLKSIGECFVSVGSHEPLGRSSSHLFDSLPLPGDLQRQRFVTLNVVLPLAATNEIWSAQQLEDFFSGHFCGGFVPGARPLLRRLLRLVFLVLADADKPVGWKWREGDSDSSERKLGEPPNFQRFVGMWIDRSGLPILSMTFK